VLDVTLLDDNSGFLIPEVIKSERKKNSHIFFKDVVRLRKDSENLASKLIGARLDFERSGRAHLHRLKSK